jgi:outer membrane protein assembly factor BamB/tRNA A-37 threonylcarbamoyl transferase component Bud32
MNTTKNQDFETFSLKKGTRLSDRYLIQSTISVSPTSTVYQARDLHFPSVQKMVVIKEFRNPSPDPQVRQANIEAFERKANLLATLSHPGLPGILDYFTQGRHSYLVMEFIQGMTLAAILEESSGSTSQEQVAQWSIALCEVLEYLHSHQPEAITMQDLDLTGIMLDVHNNLAIVNFGIASIFQIDLDTNSESSLSASADSLGSHQEMIAKDIYDLGESMYILLTGKKPDTGVGVSPSQGAIRLNNPEVSVKLENVILKAMQSDPVQRFQNAEEMKTALLDVIGRSESRQLAIQFDQVSPLTDESIQPRWTFSCADEVRGTACYADGVIYFGSYDQHLYAVKAESGSLLWKYETDGGIVSRPAVMNDSVFVGSEDNRLHVVSARSGSLLWTYYTKGPVRSSPYLAHGHVFIGSDDFNIHAININGGRGIWQIDTIAEVRSTPFVTQDEVYAGNESGEFYCIDFRGGIKWRYKAKRAVTSSAVVADDMVMFCSLDKHIYALDAKSGYLIWRFKMDKGSISSPCVANGLLYTGSIDGNIYCINAKNAKEVWRFQTEHQVTGSPIVSGDGLYCGSVDGNLYCLDNQTGHLRWKFKTEKPITATPVAVNDMIFIGSTNNQFYALPETLSS